MRKPVRLMIVALLSVASFVIAALAYLYFMQERLVFFPEPLEAGAKLSFEAPHSEHFLERPGGRKVHYLLFSPPEAKVATIYFHGNGGNLARWGHVAAQYAIRTGHEVWIMDYPGYGKSTGPLPKNSDELLEMGRDFILMVRNARKDIPLLFYGRSIGTGIASKLAMTENADALVLEAPYTSLRALAKEIYPLVPGQLLRYHLDNTELAENTKRLPILIVHGTDDAVIPHSHGESLFKTLKTRAAFLSIPGGTHDDLTEREKYWRGFSDFLDSTGL